MRENTTGPVRGDRTAARPGATPVPTFSEREQRERGVAGDQRRIDDAAARREPLTEPVPVAGGALRQQTQAQQTQPTQSEAQQTQTGVGTAARKVEQTGPAGAAAPKQDERKTDRREDPGTDRDGQRDAGQQAKTDQLDATPIPDRADVPADTSAEPATAKPDETAAAKPDQTATAKPTNGKADTADDTTVLFGEDAATGFRTRWRELQADFVDDPKRAVEGADKLVDEVLNSLTQSLAKHKQGLAGGWQDHGETEELRQALRKYRSFLDQLLKT